MWEGCISGGDTSGSTVPVFNEWGKSVGRRALAYKLCEILDDIVTQATEKVSLSVRLPSGPDTPLPALWGDLRRDFIAQLGTRRPPHIELWPFQLAAAARSIDPNDDLCIALPTSAGKTRIAELCILQALADGKRTIYVTPLRALSAQIERVLAKTFVPLGATGPLRASSQIQWIPINALTGEVKSR